MKKLRRTLTTYLFGTSGTESVDVNSTGTESVDVNSTGTESVDVNSTGTESVDVNSTGPAAMAVDSTGPAAMAVNSTVPAAMAVDSTVPAAMAVDSTVPAAMNSTKPPGHDNTEFILQLTASFHQFRNSLAEYQEQVGYTAKCGDNQEELDRLLHDVISSLSSSSLARYKNFILHVKRWSDKGCAVKQGWPSTYHEANSTICGVDSYWDSDSKLNRKPPYIRLVEEFVKNVNELLQRYGKCSTLTIYADASRYSREPMSADKLKPEVLGIYLLIKTPDENILSNTNEEDREKISEAFAHYDRENKHRSAASTTRARDSAAALNRIRTAVEKKNLRSPKELAALINEENLKFTVHPNIGLSDPEKAIVKNCFNPSSDVEIDAAIINSAADKLWSYLSSPSSKTIGKNRKRKGVMLNPFELAQNNVYTIRYYDDETVGKNVVEKGFVVITKCTNCTETSKLSTAMVSYRWFDVNMLQFAEKDEMVYAPSTMTRLKFCDLVEEYQPDLTQRYKSKMANERLISKRMKMMKVD